MPSVISQTIFSPSVFMNLIDFNRTGIKSGCDSISAQTESQNMEIEEPENGLCDETDGSNSVDDDSDDELCFTHDPLEGQRAAIMNMLTLTMAEMEDALLGTKESEENFIGNVRTVLNLEITSDEVRRAKQAIFDFVKSQPVATKLKIFSRYIWSSDFSGLDLRDMNFEGLAIQRSNFSNANLEGAKFTDLILHNTVFTGANLSGADFTGADLLRSEFIRANLTGANFSGAKLCDVDMSWAILKNANLEASILLRTKFYYVDLQNVNFIGLNLKQALFFCANLEGACFKGMDLYGIKIVESDLKKADFSDADLQNADLSLSSLVGANLNGANLRHANFSGANLHKFDFTDHDLSGVEFCGANLSNTNFKGMDLTNVELMGANLSDADFSHTNLIWKEFGNANLNGTNLSSANLQGTIFIDAYLCGTNFSGANVLWSQFSTLSGVDRNLFVVDQSTQYSFRVKSFRDVSRHLITKAITHFAAGHNGSNDVGLKPLTQANQAGPKSVQPNNPIRSTPKVDSVKVALPQKQTIKPELTVNLPVKSQSIWGWLASIPFKVMDFLISIHASIWRSS